DPGRPRPCRLAPHPAPARRRRAMEPLLLRGEETNVDRGATLRLISPESIVMDVSPTAHVPGSDTNQWCAGLKHISGSSPTANHVSSCRMAHPGGPALRSASAYFV